MPLISPDRRPTCGRTTASNAQLFLGGCFQQQNNNYDKITVLYNVTAVPDYHSASLGQPIAPYPRPEQTTAPDCSPYNNGGCPDNPCYKCHGVAGGENNPYCGKPDPTSDFLPCGGAPTHSFQVGRYYNCYAPSQTGETMSLSACRHIGFKNVYAHKIWQGKKSYCSRDLMLPDEMDWCCSCNLIHNEDSSPDLTKYLGMSATFTQTVHTQNFDKTTTCVDVDCSPDPPGQHCCWSRTDTTAADFTENASSAVHIDKYGNFYVDSCSSGSTGYTDPGTADFAAADAFGRLGAVNGNQGDAISFYCSFILPGMPDVITGGGASWHIEYHTHYTCCDDCGRNCVDTDYAFLIADIDIASGTAHVQEFEADQCGSGCGCCYEVLKTLDETVSIGCTTYSIVLYAFFRSASVQVDTTTNSTLTGGLNTTYTSADVKAEIPVLLGTWDMGDDIIYPWRDGTGDRTVGPVVHYDEGGNVPSIGTTCVSDIRFTASLVIGAPALSVKGIDKIWSPDHTNWCICDSLVQPGCLDFYVKDWGAWSNSIGVPLATDWLNQWEASQIPPDIGSTWANQFWTTPSTCNSNGPSRIFDDTLWGVKYAQILFQKESYSWARPCEVDRYMISESTDRCVTGSSGMTLVGDPNTEPDFSVYNPGDYVWVCGVGGIEDGMYKVASVAGYELTLGKGLISASLLPSVPTYDCGTGVVYLLRWQTLYPAICGRIQITTVTSGSVSSSLLTCSLADPTYLANDDNVIIEHALGCSGTLNGTWTAIVIDASTIALSGSNGNGLTPYTHSSGDMRSSNSKDYKWDDDSPKNNFRRQEWQFNYRDVGEFYRISQSVPYQTSQGTCDGLGFCPAQSIPAEPRPYQIYCGMPQEVSFFTASTHCLPLNACSPQVMVCSPNFASESFTKTSSSIVAAYDAGFTVVDIDSKYGSNWILEFRQSCGDPLFVPPPCPCQTIFDEGLGKNVFACGCYYLEDVNGGCTADDLISVPCFQYYPERNLYECRNEPPAGAPALPSGVYYGCLPQSVMNSSTTCPPGNVCYPPWAWANDIFNFGEGCGMINIEDGDTPWADYLNRLACVCGSGRWSNQYQLNGTFCTFTSMNVLPPP